ncbi:cytochrome P450 4C1-like [Homalodisca vitripennis]|uniref:cytochrome P450 4C1-like n=1 Tax=Homalodisca vitripennis TaxID=197043 RepID=UPI001EEAA31C|nr:cytochrome P450 4C1-like [Homalodisca vitripennis]
MIILLLVSLLSLLILYHLVEQQRTSRMRKIISKVPGPTKYPIIGSSLEFGRNSVELMTNLQRMAADYGPVFKVWMGPTLYVVLSDARDVEVVLSSSVHLNKPQVYDFLKKWLGTGLVSAPAVRWKSQRRILTPAFHFKILETYIDIFNANARIMMGQLEKEVGNEKFDIAPYVDKCTLDVICETAMATSIDAQLNEESQFTKSLKVVSKAVLVRAFKPWLFPEFTFNLSTIGREFSKHLEYINSYVDKVIAQKKKSLASFQSTQDTTKDDNLYGTKQRLVFLDLLLMYAADPAVHLSDDDIRDEVNTFMFAGHDTTASTIGFAIHLLASHPDVQERAREEVKSVLGETDRDPTYQDLLNLRYLEQVIKETLRLYPAVPYIGRKLFQDLTLPSGYTIPSGAALSLFFYKIHRDPEVFPEPEKFNPENFLPERLVGRFAFSYTPFSAGPRNCIGQKFAMLEMKATLSRLLLTYNITSQPPAPVLAAELILRSVTGINVRLEKRS